MFDKDDHVSNTAWIFSVSVLTSAVDFNQSGKNIVILMWTAKYSLSKLTCVALYLSILIGCADMGDTKLQALVHGIIPPTPAVKLISGRVFLTADNV